MPLTLRDLVSTPDLSLRLVADGAGVGRDAAASSEQASPGRAGSGREGADGGQDSFDGVVRNGAALPSNPVIDRSITWVHVSELRDPTPFLSGGELLLTTGLAFDAATMAEEYVGRLADAGVVGVGFGTGLSHRDVPVELIRAAQLRGLPVLEVPRRTPFIAISRAVSKAIAADEYASVAKTFTAQQALTKAALAPAGPGRLVRLLAQQISAWVVLLDPTGVVMESYPDDARSRVGELSDEIAVLTSHRGPVSSGFPLGSDTVSVQSVGTDRRGRAFLAVGRPGPLTAVDRHLVNAAVMLLTIRLAQISAGRGGLGPLRSAILRLVIAGHYQLARPIAEEAGIALPVEPIAVLVGSGGLDDGLEVVEAIVRNWSRVVVPIDGSVGFVAELDDRWVALAHAGGVTSEALADGLGSERESMGVSDSVPYAEIEVAYRQAMQAAEFGRTHGRSVTTYADISMPGLTALLDPDHANAFAESLLRPLLEHDRHGRGDLVNSLREWLSHHGQWDPSATSLGVHRHTLRHRMRTVEELLGRSLDSPGTRSELWLALELIDRG